MQGPLEQQTLLTVHRRPAPSRHLPAAGTIRLGAPPWPIPALQLSGCWASRCSFPEFLRSNRAMTSRAFLLLTFLAGLAASGFAAAQPPEDTGTSQQPLVVSAAEVDAAT